MSCLPHLRFQVLVTALAMRELAQNQESAPKSCRLQLLYKALKEPPPWFVRFPARAPRSYRLRLLLRVEATLVQAHMWLRSRQMAL